MKTPEQVDAIMERIDERSRYRWCGGERGPCACMGCVQICSRSLMYEKTYQTEHRGDPEYIDYRRFPPIVHERYGVTREEWEAWKERHPEPEREPSQYGITSVSIGSPAGEMTDPRSGEPWPPPIQVAAIGSGAPMLIHGTASFRVPKDIPVEGVEPWTVRAARKVQSAMYSGDWTIETIARKISEAYERKDSTP